MNLHANQETYTLLVLIHLQRSASWARSRLLNQVLHTSYAATQWVAPSKEAPKKGPSFSFNPRSKLIIVDPHQKIVPHPSNDVSNPDIFEPAQCRSSDSPISKRSRRASSHQRWKACKCLVQLGIKMGMGMICLQKCTIDGCLEMDQVKMVAFTEDFLKFQSFVPLVLSSLSDQGNCNVTKDAWAVRKTRFHV